MKTLLAALLLVTVLACPALQAQQAGGGEVLIVKIQDLNLTDAQESKIADIRKDCQVKVQQAAEELSAFVKEEVEKVRGVLTAAQKQKLQDLKEEREESRLEGVAHGIVHLKELDLTDDEIAKIQNIQREYRPRIASAMEAFKGILNEQQRREREQGVSAGKTRTQVLNSLNLTPDQKQKVETACKKVNAVVREELEKIKDVLTPEQRAKLADLKDERREHVRDRMAHRIAEAKDLNLTAEQKTKIEEIRKDYRPRIHEAGNRMRAAVRDEAEQILAVIRE